MNGISALIIEVQESSLSYHVRTQQKYAIYEQGNGLSPDIKSAGILILDFPNFRTMRNKYLFFIFYSVSGILL